MSPPRDFACIVSPRNTSFPPLVSSPLSFFFWTTLCDSPFHESLLVFFFSFCLNFSHLSPFPPLETSPPTDFLASAGLPRSIPLFPPFFSPPRFCVFPQMKWPFHPVFGLLCFGRFVLVVSFFFCRGPFLTNAWVFPLKIPPPIDLPRILFLCPSSPGNRFLAWPLFLYFL